MPSAPTLDEQCRLLLNPEDPLLRPFLSEQAAPQSLEEARACVHALFSQYGPPMAEINRREQFQIDNRLGQFAVECYWPTTHHRDPLPLLLFLHGGGWVQGELATYHGLASQLCAQAGVVVASVGYHLAPEHPYPHGLEDCYTALEWAVDHAEQLGIDTHKIIVMGDSAGGNLATVLTRLNQQRRNLPIQAQILCYPMVDVSLDAQYPSRLHFGQGEYLLQNSQIEASRECYITDPQQATDPFVSPLFSPNLNDLPRALILTAEFDPLRDEAKCYHDKLLAGGTVSEYHCVPGTIHGFLSLAKKLDAGKDGLEFLAGKIRQYLEISY